MSSRVRLPARPSDEACGLHVLPSSRAAEGPAPTEGEPCSAGSPSGHPLVPWGQSAAAVERAAGRSIGRPGEPTAVHGRHQLVGLKCLCVPPGSEGTPPCWREPVFLAGPRGHAVAPAGGGVSGGFEDLREGTRGMAVTGGLRRMVRPVLAAEQARSRLAPGEQLGLREGAGAAPKRAAGRVAHGWPVPKSLLLHSPAVPLSPPVHWDIIWPPVPAGDEITSTQQRVQSTACHSRSPLL